MSHAFLIEIVVSILIGFYIRNLIFWTKTCKNIFDSLWKKKEKNNMNLSKSHESPIWDFSSDSDRATQPQTAIQLNPADNQLS